MEDGLPLTSATALWVTTEGPCHSQCRWQDQPPLGITGTFRSNPQADETLSSGVECLLARPAYGRKSPGSWSRNSRRKSYKWGRAGGDGPWASGLQQETSATHHEEFSSEHTGSPRERRRAGAGAAPATPVGDLAAEVEEGPGNVRLLPL